MFVGEDQGTKCIMVSKDPDTSMVMSGVAPLKGTRHKFATNSQRRAFINELEFEHAKFLEVQDRDKRRRGPEHHLVDGRVCVHVVHAIGFLEAVPQIPKIGSSVFSRAEKERGVAVWTE